MNVTASSRQMKINSFHNTFGWIPYIFALHRSGKIAFVTLFYISVVILIFYYCVIEWMGECEKGQSMIHSENTQDDKSLASKSPWHKAQANFKHNSFNLIFISKGMNYLIFVFFVTAYEIVMWLYAYYPFDTL